MEFKLVNQRIGTSIDVRPADIVCMTSYPGSKRDPLAQAGADNESDIQTLTAWNVKGDASGDYINERIVTLELARNEERYDVFVPTGDADELARVLELEEVQSDVRGRVREWVPRPTVVISRKGGTYDASGRRLLRRPTTTTTTTPTLDEQ